MVKLIRKKFAITMSCTSNDISSSHKMGLRVSFGFKTCWVCNLPIFFKKGSRYLDSNPINWYNCVRSDRPCNTFNHWMMNSFSAFYF